MMTVEEVMTTSRHHDTNVIAGTSKVHPHYHVLGELFQLRGEEDNDK